MSTFKRMFKPCVIDPTMVKWRDGPIRFNHVEKIQDGGLKVYFDYVTCSTGRDSRQTKTLRCVVCVVHPVQPVSQEKEVCGGLEEEKHEAMNSALDYLDEETDLLCCELKPVQHNSSTKESSPFHLTLLGASLGGTRFHPITITGTVTLYQVTSNHFTAACTKHRRARGASAGQRYWQNFIHGMMEENFPHTTMLLRGES